MTVGKRAKNQWKARLPADIDTRSRTNFTFTLPRTSPQPLPLTSNGPAGPGDFSVMDGMGAVVISEPPTAAPRKGLPIFNLDP